MASEYTIQQSVPVTAAGYTDIWTPSGSRRFRLTGISFNWSANVSLLSGRPVIVTVYDQGSPMPIQQTAYVPLVPASPITLPMPARRYSFGSGLISAALGNKLRVHLSHELTTGLVRVIAVGGEEA